MRELSIAKIYQTGKQYFTWPFYLIKWGGRRLSLEEKRKSLRRVCSLKRNNRVKNTKTEAVEAMPPSTPVGKGSKSLGQSGGGGCLSFLLVDLQWIILMCSFHSF